jgi:hypothetical protein
MFENDFFMREMSNLSKALALVFFHKESSTIEMFNEEGSVSDSGFLYHSLKKLVKDGQINEAENIIFQEIEKDSSEENFQVAIRFYHDLQQLSDQTLQQCNFSRQEILDGLESVQKLLKEKLESNQK